LHTNRRRRAINKNPKHGRGVLDCVDVLRDLSEVDLVRSVSPEEVDNDG